MPVLSGAEPFAHDGSEDVGVLLCHGFTSTPQSMRAWGEHLAAEGVTVRCPLLPGHGTSWQELNRTRWADWYGEVDRAFEKLRANHDQVVVGGLSMGGGLALRLAADRGREVAGVVVVNPAVSTERKDVLALPVLKHVVRSLPGIANDIKKPGEIELAYKWSPLKAAHSMLQGYAGVRHDLGRVTAPLLIWRSVEDHVVDPSSARIIAASVSSRRRRADSLRHVSTRRRAATVINQPLGLAGTPSVGHCSAAASRASCTASSHVSKPP